MTEIPESCRLYVTCSISLRKAHTDPFGDNVMLTRQKLEIYLNRKTQKWTKKRPNGQPQWKTYDEDCVE